MRALKVSFAILCYLIGFGCIIYYFDFFTGFFVPKSIDSGNPESFLNAVLIDLGLITLFGLQHTLMARSGFKEWSEKVLPPSLTRSYYILATSIGLGLVIWFWQPIPLVIYDLKGTAAGSLLLGLYYLGWAVGLLSSFELDHFRLFGVKQALFPHKKETDELKAPFFYRIVRHPNYLGWILIHWMTPLLTVGHLLFAAGITAYIYIGLIFEERDLVKHFGDQYREYKKVTPKLNPLLFPFKRSRGAMKVIKFIAVVAAILFIGRGIQLVMWVNTEVGMMKSDDPLIWKEEVTRLSQQNASFWPDSEAVLFVGSSSFRFWDRIDEDLYPLKVINNGFGGAKVADVMHFKEDLIYPYNSSEIVFFLGSNDISGADNDKSPEELYDSYAKLALAVHKQMPESQIYILPITPTLARWDVWPQVQKANEIIKMHSSRVDWVTFIDVADSFLTDRGEPIWKYYKWDGTHLSHAGYQIWADALKKFLINDDQTQDVKIKSKQRTLEYTQQIKGSPDEIFPLLCPKRESDWLVDWEYDMIYSESGYAEDNAVFTTPMHGEGDTYWTVSRYEPLNHRIEFVRFTLPEVIVKIAIQVHEQKGEFTPVDISYTYTALSEEQNEYLDGPLTSDFKEGMIWWEKSMNYYLETGKMLKDD